MKVVLITIETLYAMIKVYWKYPRVYDSWIFNNAKS